MKQNLHPAAIAAAIAVLVVAVGALFLKFGSPEVKGASMADRMKIEVNHNKVNSITGEPLTDDQVAAQARQNDMVQKMQAAGQDPRGRGTAPKLEPDAH